MHTYTHTVRTDAQLCYKPTSMCAHKPIAALVRGCAFSLGQEHLLGPQRQLCSAEFLPNSIVRDQKFKVILGCIPSLRPARVTQNHLKNNTCVFQEKVILPQKSPGLYPCRSRGQNCPIGSASCLIQAEILSLGWKSRETVSERVGVFSLTPDPACS